MGPCREAGDYEPGRQRDHPGHRDLKPADKPEPTLLVDGSSRPRSRRVVIIGDDRLPPPSIGRGS
eukprot:833586-Pyramimonas_sp.AAC.1